VPWRLVRPSSPARVTSIAPVLAGADDRSIGLETEAGGTEPPARCVARSSGAQRFDRVDKDAVGCGGTVSRAGTGNRKRRTEATQRPGLILSHPDVRGVSGEEDGIRRMGDDIESAVGDVAEDSEVGQWLFGVSRQ
jgi:hypothetical protein